MTERATIDSATAARLPMFPLIQEDTLGRLFVPARQVGEILVVDTTGRILTTIGTVGAGPLEFHRPLPPLSGPGDSLHIYEPFRQRVTVLSADLRFVRALHLSGTPSLVQGDGSYVVAEQIRTRELLGQPLHVFAGSGEVLRSFGAEIAQHRTDLSLLTTRAVGRADAESFWAAAPGRYVLQRWSARTGALISTIRVKSSWFEDSEVWNDDETMRPRPVIERVWQELGGPVWVLLRDSDQNWAPPAKANTMRPLDVDEYEATYDWVLEAIDPVGGAVLASRRFSCALWIYPGSALIISRRTASEQSRAFRAWQPFLFVKEAVQ